MDPKGANLASTDLLEISELVSGSYVTKSITGAEIISGATTGFVPTSRTLTINGTTQDLSADRTFTVSTGITIGTTAITSGTVGRVLFEGTGNVVQESANLFWDNTNGRLGIGSATPLTALSVNSLRPTISIRDTTGSTNSSYFGSFDDFLQIAVNRNPSTGVFTNTGKASAQISMEGSTSSGKIFFYATNTNGATPLEAMRINGTGNVLINTTTDAGFKLDVNGTVRVSGNQTNGGHITVGSISTGSSIGYYIQNAGVSKWGIRNDAGFESNGFNISNASSVVLMEIGQGGNVGIGTLGAVAPASKLHIKGSGTTSSTTSFLVQNANASASLTVTDDGIITLGTADYTPTDSFNPFAYTVKTRTGIYVANPTTNYGMSYEWNRLYANLGYGGGNPTLIASNAAWTSNIRVTAPSLRGTDGIFTSGINKFVAPEGGTDLNLIFGGSTTVSLVQGRVAAYGETHNPKRGALEIYAGTDSTYSNISFYTSGSEKLRITNGGNFLVNTTTDAGFKLDVNGTARVSGALTVTTDLYLGNNTIGFFKSTNDFNFYNLANGSVKYRITGASQGFGISDNGYDTVATSAMLQVNSTTKGFLPPRMTTTQKNAIASPAEGLMIYDTVLKRPCFYDGTSWVTL